ncbi:MAG: enoyl-CoA hydratase/isomerase family protein [Ilumatobacteraceae bacterium]
MATDSTFALPEVEIGLFPEMSAVALLPRLVGYDRALELALTGRRIDAHEADRIGLVTALVEPDAVVDEALSLAATIARARPDAIRYCKRAMRLGAAGDVDGSLRTAREGGLRLLNDLIIEWDPERPAR